MSDESPKPVNETPAPEKEVSKPAASESTADSPKPVVKRVRMAKSAKKKPANKKGEDSQEAPERNEGEKPNSSQKREDGNQRNKNEQGENNQKEGENSGEGARKQGRNRRNRNGRGNRQDAPEEAKVKLNNKLVAKRAWKIFLGEVNEEGLVLIADKDAKELAKRSLRVAEIYSREEAAQTQKAKQSEKNTKAYSKPRFDPKQDERPELKRNEKPAEKVSEKPAEKKEEAAPAVKAPEVKPPVEKAPEAKPPVKKTEEPGPIKEQPAKEAEATDKPEA